MKLIINENQLKFLVNEYINPSEAHNDVESVRLICDGKRGVAYVTAFRLTDYEEIVEMVSECDLDSYKVPNNPNDAYVIFNKDYKDEAKELLSIIVSLGGYLSPEAPEDVTRRIGELLNYEPEEVENFIRKRSINESVSSAEITNAIDSNFNNFVSKYPKQIKNANSLVDMNGIIETTKEYLKQTIPTLIENNIQPQIFLNKYYSFLLDKFNQTQVGWAKKKMLQAVLGKVQDAPATLDKWVFKEIIWSLLSMGATTTQPKWNKDYLNLVENNKLPFYHKIRDSLINKIYS